MGRLPIKIRLITAVAGLLGIALPVYCTELVLKDGTVCTGTIISEDAEAFMFQKGTLKLRINKLLVIRKDGIRYAGARVIPQKTLRPLAAQAAEALPEQPSATTSQPAVAGASAPGALPRPKPRVNVVAMSGDPAGVASAAPSPSPLPPQSAASLPAGTDDASGQLRVIAAPKYGFVAEKANRASVDPAIVNGSGGVPVSAPAPQAAVRSVDAPTKQDRSQEQAGVSSSPPALATGAVERVAPLAIVQPPAPLPAGILPDPPRNAPAAPRMASQATAPATPPMARSPVKTKRPDGRQELVLMDGTVFVGKISAQTDRFFTFSSEGASITILKRLVKSIDGETFQQGKSPEPAGPPPSAPATAEVDRRSEKHVPAATMFRMLPSTELPQGYTVSLLIDSMRNGADPKCRSRAARYCGAMGPWAVSAIGAAAQLLSDTAQSREAPPVVIDSSTVDLFLAPGLEAARALSQLGPQGEEELVRALAGNNRLVKMHAVFGLGTCFQESAEKAVKAALKDPDPVIRRTALGSLRVITAQPLLLAALGDVDPSVRSAAVTLLGRIADRTSVKRVAGMAKDNSQPVRKSTAAALGMFGVPEASPALVQLTRDADNFVRAEAVLALGKVKDGATVDALLTMLKDPTPDVRAGAIDALGSFRDSRAIPSLYAALKDENATVRKRAQAALRQLTEIPLLTAALDDESTTVRANAAYVLWLMTGQDYGSDKAKWESWVARKGGGNPQK